MLMSWNHFALAPACWHGMWAEDENNLLGKIAQTWAIFLC